MSVRISSADSAAVFAITSEPVCWIDAVSSGVRRMRTSSAFSRPITGAGVRAGTSTICQLPSM
jgi:hypothetical protein